MQIGSGLIATGDIDLLYDARRHISLAVTGLVTEGSIGLLKKVDRSFAPTRPRGFRAARGQLECEADQSELVDAEPADGFLKETCPKRTLLGFAKR